MELYSHEKYLRKIRGFYHDTEVIKVLTGVRRCGKSCLMETIQSELLSAGVDSKNIIYLDLDKRKYRKIKTDDQLENLIESQVSRGELRETITSDYLRHANCQSVFLEFNSDKYSFR